MLTKEAIFFLSMMKFVRAEAADIYEWYNDRFCGKSKRDCACAEQPCVLIFEHGLPIDLFLSCKEVSLNSFIVARGVYTEYIFDWISYPHQSLPL